MNRLGLDLMGLGFIFLCAESSLEVTPRDTIAKRRGSRGLYRAGNKWCKRGGVVYTNWTGASGHPIWLHSKWTDAVARGVFSCRQGGSSQPPWASLNVGMHVDDDSVHVRENRRYCAQAVGGCVEDWVVGQQVHGTAVHVVRVDERGRGGKHGLPAIEGVDALVTNVPGITLVVMAADCVPMLFYDPVRCVIAAAHSGWKGTVGHISREVLSTMQSTYGTRPEDVQVSLGPSIRRCCYEVDDAVQRLVVREFGEHPFVPRFHHPGKYMLGLQLCIWADLVAAGILPKNVEDVGVCTACHTKELFSYRMEHGRTGRQMGAIRLNTNSTY